MAGSDQERVRREGKLKIQNIKTLKDTRGEPTNYLLNFLQNMARAAILMHKVLEACRKDEHVIKEACRQYVIALASCMETFYRDLCLFVISNDDQVLKIILGEVREKSTFADIHQILCDGATFPDIASSSLGFQNIEQIEASMSKIFPPKGYISSLTEFELECLVPAKGARATIRLPEDWRAKFADFFQQRHEYVHNSNFDFDLSLSDMARLEALVLMIAQLSAHNIAQRYSDKGALMMAGHPVFFLVEDFLSTDWELCAEGEIGISVIRESNV